MSVEGISRTFLVWHQLVKETLATHSEYYKYPDENVTWAIENWLAFTQANLKEPTIIYRGLILANRNKLLGKFSLTFNTQLSESILKMKPGRFNDALKDAFLPEVEHNTLFPEEERQNLLAELRREMMSLNYVINQAISMETPPESLIASDLEEKSFHEVCISGLLGSEVKVDDFRLSSLPPTVMVFENLENSTASYIWCFNLLELMRLVVEDAPNPHTGMKISKATRKQLAEKFSIPHRMYTYWSMTR
jgi:hypothetical protein